MTKRTPHNLNFPELGREIRSDGAESIYHSARRHGVRIVGACGGRGTCGTCVVSIVEGRVELAGAQAEAEPGQAGGETRARKWVRACRAHARSDCTVEVAPRSLALVVRAEMETGGTEEHLPFHPAVVAEDIVVPEATLTDTRSDADRVAQALARPVDGFDLAVARQLPQALRAESWRLRVWRRGGEVIGCAPRGRRLLGLAVDLGTTNAAAFLLDLERGERLASLGIENPQAAWGADLISRINHAARAPESARELREAAVAAINGLAHDLCRAVGAQAADIADIAVCGNTAMHHLLLGLPVHQLGRAPFVAAVRDAVDVKARELGIEAGPGAWLHAAPNIGGFVGGDHVTALLATEERWRGASASLVMDIGTNTEISLIHRGEILSVSSPSGPALEGGHISCGMRAALGAIERVTLEDGRIAVATIGRREAVGLCGSGVLDALAVLHRAGIADDRGRLAAGHPDVVERDGVRAAVLAPGVSLTQDDVRAVQLAKAAIRTGTELLLQEAGLRAADLERFIVAGAFGAYLDVASGVEIGLFPDLPAERFEQVGNAAGVGVRHLLASTRARARARELAAAARYIELSTRAGFQKAFMNHIGFGRKST